MHSGDRTVQQPVNVRSRITGGSARRFLPSVSFVASHSRAVPVRKPVRQNAGKPFLGLNDFCSGGYSVVKRHPAHDFPLGSAPGSGIKKDGGRKRKRYRPARALKRLVPCARGRDGELLGIC